MGSAIGPAIGAVGSIAGGIAGQQASSGDLGESRNQAIIANQILQELQNAPDISKPLILEKYKQQGVLTPEMEQNINAQMPSNINTDPRYKAAQMQALQQMQQRANTGLTQGDRAALQQSNLAAQGDVQSRLGSIQDKMQQQGLADSGSALAMKLAAAQSGANQESANANQLAQNSQQAREQALANLGQFGSQLQGQDFGQQLAQQQAQQQMQRFNIQNQLGVQQQNVANANNAQAANLANAQNVSNMNVGNQNQELNNQLQRQMQQYGQNVNTAQIKAGGAGRLSGQLNDMGAQAGQNAYNQWAGAGQAVGGLAGAFGGSKKPTLNDNQGQFIGVAHGGQIPDYKRGGEVPGKAPVDGDSPANDIVHAMLSPGEIVLPRTLSESKFGKHILKIIDAHNNLKKHVNEQE